MKKSIVELDLVGYSTITETLQQSLGAKAIVQVNSQIQEFIDQGLTVVCGSRDANVMVTTGDGAIVVFDSAEQAVCFVAAVHERTAKHNRDKTDPIGKRIFRVGVATGDIEVSRNTSGGYDIAGTAIARAVRLEGKSSPGGVLIDNETAIALPQVQRLIFGDGETIQGKRDEQFLGYRAQFDLAAEKEAGHIGRSHGLTNAVLQRKLNRSERGSILELFDLLPESQYFKVAYLLEMPVLARPAYNLELFQQQERIIRWAEHAKQLDVLLEVLQNLASKAS